MNMMYEQYKADLCLYFEWKGNTHVVLVAWVNDVMILGPPELVEKVQEQLKKSFMCKHEEIITEHGGSKITMSYDATELGTVSS